ncbi:MAG: ThuA domain-containing protein [Luteimonas sp.]|nr:ThuA domain-containing protein [Luteimonas sp.]
MSARWIAMLLALCVALAGCVREPLRKIVLIGGAKSEAPGRHDYPDGVRAIARLLAESPEARRANLVVEAFPDGWPDDPAALAGAAAVIWYFDGLDRHPLHDPAIRDRFEAAMRAGTGLVALHQASTVPPEDDLGLPRWLGAVREGMFDRTTQWAALEPTAASHPVSRGVEPFEHRDEFYPTLAFAPGAVPLLSADLDVQYRDGSRRIEETPMRATVAWAYEREGGGRAVGFTGAHFLAALDTPTLRKVLLNAIFWSAGVEVPARGVRTGAAAQPDAAADEASAQQASPADWPTFQHDPQRTGWDDTGAAPARANIGGASFGLVWESPQLDGFDGHPPRLYASPLYLDRLRMTNGPLRGETFPAVIAASSAGFVYAVNAANVADVAAGRILWRRRLGEPCRLQPALLDGVPTGILSTPVADVARGRLYVTHCDPLQRWQAYALDLGSGRVLPGTARCGWTRRRSTRLTATPAPARAAATQARFPRAARRAQPQHRRITAVRRLRRKRDRLDRVSGYRNAARAQRVRHPGHAASRRRRHLGLGRPRDRCRREHLRRDRQRV